ncbi:polyunsaturated fatty acid lipoxygenase ALOX15B isoform X1 [Sminthopsis crassicaudata]|uniref:polyunsaturated fatty acid lipoxygenase ALOX15B isoform X1 n=1 Tax=Sminthopsis crassicaudata TaxID=9301 RepID=UPI003D6852E8
MAIHIVRVSTGSFLGVVSWDNISISLVGTEGESLPLKLGNFGKDFNQGVEEDFEVKILQDVSSELLLQIHNASPEQPKSSSLNPDAWFCQELQLISPKNPPLHFPCYQWLEGTETLVLREGAAKVIWAESSPILLEQRRLELKQRQQKYRWNEYFPGLPHCLDADNLKELDPNLRSFTSKNSVLKLRTMPPQMGLKMKGMLDRKGPWQNMDEIREIFVFLKSEVSEYVAEHWQDDEFFASQFLNGLNPVLIQCCHSLPDNFPVTNSMVAPLLGPGTSLQEELEKGSLYLVNHGLLSGLSPGLIDGRPQYVAAPMTLLHQKPNGGPLLPIAIQLNQTPGPNNPIFLPSDSEEDWLLAKTWVRNSEFLIHEMVTHLLCTHFISEVFAIATMRQLPMCHPIFKLLIPHFHFTFHINTIGRVDLFKPGGLIDKSTALGHLGCLELVARGMKILTYRSLCLPHNLADRGVQGLANYHYRDDGLQIWDAVERFVSSIIDIYYPEDRSVFQDSELQAWVQEIFMEGFLGQECSGIPTCLETLQDLVQFLTMIIFNSSAQHAAVNSGQFDFSAWVPNIPTSMRLPPPITKGTADFLGSLGDVSTACHALILFWGVSDQERDMKLLGTYPELYFTEEAPKQSIAAFRNRLVQISRDIQERNKGLDLPYTYLDPLYIENSVAI